MFKIKELSIDEVINRIIKLNDGLRQFWTKAICWAPIEAAQLMSVSRLDWQVSLSKCLRIWLTKHTQDEESGYLILAWVNLGSLVEGTMKLFLSVWYKDYKCIWYEDYNSNIKGNKLICPDSLQMERMRQFFEKNIWKEDDKNWGEWIHHIQFRRNTIHAYKNREIGNFNEYFDDVKKYLKFLRYINNKLPYPDNVYVPKEI